MKVQKLIPELQQDYERRRSIQLIITGPLVVSVIALVWARQHPDSSVIGIPAYRIVLSAFAVIVSGMVFSVRNWRCPACDRYLGKAWNPRHCANCGVQLRGESAMKHALEHE